MRSIEKLPIIIVIISILLAAVMPNAVATNPEYTMVWDANWYDDNYGYRVAFPMFLPGGCNVASVTDYVMNITVRYGTGTHSTNTDYINLYTRGKCRTDFEDIIFVDTDNTTLLHSWRQEYVASSYAVFWVEFPSITKAANTTYYMYMGNASKTIPDADTAEDQDLMNDTFVFSDNFYLGSLDTNKWDIQAGTPVFATEDSRECLKMVQNADYAIDSDDNIDCNSTVFMKMKWAGQLQDVLHHWIGFYDSGSDTARAFLGHTDVSKWYCYIRDDGGTQNLYPVSVTPSECNDWHDYFIDWAKEETNFYFMWDDDMLSSLHAGSYYHSDLPVYLKADDDAQADVFIDYIFVANHTYKGPEIGNTPNVIERQGGVFLGSVTNVDVDDAKIGAYIYGAATCGFWIGNSSVNSTTFFWNVSKGSQSNTTFTQTLSNAGITLYSGQYYYYLGWANRSGTYYNTSLGTFLTKPNAPTNLTVVAVNGTNATLTWDNASVNATNQTTVIVYNTTDYPTAVSEGTVGYNGTAEIATIEGLEPGTMYYYSAFTYINASGSPYYWWYSDLFDSDSNATEGGLYNISIRWECNDTLVDLSGTSNNFTAFDVDGSILNETSPNDADGTFQVSPTETPALFKFIYDDGIERVILVNPTETNFTIYIPCGDSGTAIGDWAAVTIYFVDYSGSLTRENEAIGYLFKWNGTTKEYIHMDYLQADKTLRAYLTIGDTYYVGAGCSDFNNDDLGPLIITSSEYYVDVFDNSNQSSNWEDIFDVSIGWADTTLYFDFEDTSHAGGAGVWNTTIQLYDFNYTNSTLLHTYYPPLAWDFNYTNASLNTSHNFNVKITVKYESSTQNWTASRYYTIYGFSSVITNATDINEKTTAVFGLSPVRIGTTVIAYTSLIAAFLSIFALFSLSEEYAGFGIMAVAAVLAFFKEPLGLLTNDVFNWIAVTVIFMLGILTIIVMKRRT